MIPYEFHQEALPMSKEIEVKLDGPWRSSRLAIWPELKNIKVLAGQPTYVP